jgi:ABC-2 type transport system permease protein
MKPATADAPNWTEDLPARRGFDVAALAALFTLTLRQHVRGRRLLVLSLLFLLPSVLVILTRLTPGPPTGENLEVVSAQDLEFGIIFNFIPHALVPLTALLYAAGMIQDEVEEQTLTYLLLRPLPRPALYLTKLAATWLVTTALVVVFTTLTFAVIWWGKPQLWGEVLPERAGKTAAILALAQLGYCSLFGLVGMVTRRSLVAGLAYIFVFEGVLANIPMVVRQLTVMYYLRVLVVRWLAPADSDSWSIDLKDAVSERGCVLTLLIASAVFTLLAAVITARREFRMKTPEGG